MDNNLTDDSVTGDILFFSATRTLAFQLGKGAAVIRC